MKTICLTQGQVAFVDSWNFDWLSRWKWCALRTRNTFYAVRGSSSGLILMHRQILKLSDSKIQGDHWDGNGCNNQEANLRAATYTQNQGNRRRDLDNVSGFKGVFFWNSQKQKWQSRIVVLEKQFHLGFFQLCEDAAKAYDAAARIVFGEFARLNFPKVNKQLPKELLEKLKQKLQINKKLWK